MGNAHPAWERCHKRKRGHVTTVHRCAGRDLNQALIYLERAENKGITGATESLRKVKEALKLTDATTYFSPSGQNEYQFLESVKSILNDPNRESRLKQWRDLTSSYSTENITVADGRKAFHIGALALAGCSNLDGRQDVFNALYWFQNSTKSKFVWGNLGQALIDQQSDRKSIAQDLLGELDRPFNIEELLLHKDAFFCHIREHCIGLDYISSLLILFANAEDDETYGRVESDWRRFLSEISQEHQPDQLNDSERSLLFSGVLFERLRLQNKLDEYDLDDSRRNLYNARSYITRLKQPDDFSASAYSAINACLVEIERSSQDVVRKDVEGRIIALQSHTLKGPLGNTLGMLGDIKRWHERKEYDRIYLGLNSMESNLRIIRNLVEANNLILFNQDQFCANWQQDSQDDLLLPQVICEAAQQAILRLNAKEFRLEKTGRKLLRKDVSQASTSISMIDFSDVNNINMIRNGFEYPFQFVKIEFDTDLTEFSIGADGIRRQFFFAMAHELIFNAIKYDNGVDDIEISVRIDDGRMVFVCRNGCVSEEERNLLHASHRGHDFLKQILAKMTDSYFDISSLPASYVAKVVLGAIWSAK